MKRMRRCLLVTTIAGAVAAGSLAIPAAAADGPTASASGSRVLLIFNCHSARYKPVNLVIACGDAGLTVKGLQWSAWTGKSATGTGTGTIQTCVPDCASGGTRTGQIQINLAKPTKCSNGQRVFAKVRYTWTNGAPVGPDNKPIGPNSSAIGLGCKLLGQ